ncbi:hypothetical protein [Candidatus Spongiihabitans sp.]|uniref:hypothetical protein n=1 Tax=Candidatus Spongiihabitans sp. TaxID=3101308 RepID=UPI003C7C707D
MSYWIIGSSPIMTGRGAEKISCAFDMWRGGANGFRIGIHLSFGLVGGLSVESSSHIVIRDISAVHYWDDIQINNMLHTTLLNTAAWCTIVIWQVGANRWCDLHRH